MSKSYIFYNINSVIFYNFMVKVVPYWSAGVILGKKSPYEPFERLHVSAFYWFYLKTKTKEFQTL